MLNHSLCINYNKKNQKNTKKVHDQKQNITEECLAHTKTIFIRIICIY